MKPVDFPEKNKTYTKPEGWTDEECGSLPVYKCTGRKLTIAFCQVAIEDIQS